MLGFWTGVLIGVFLVVSGLRIVTPEMKADQEELEYYREKEKYRIIERDVCEGYEKELDQERCFAALGKKI